MRKREIEIIREIRRRLLPFSRIDPTFQYVKVAKILSEIAEKYGVTSEAIRRKYNKKILLKNKSILKGK